MKKIRKLIIPAAGWGTRFLPMTKVVHKELVPILNKPTIDFLVEESLKSGIEEIILVISQRKNELSDYFKINDALEYELESKNKNDLLEIVRATNRESFIKVVYQNEQLGLGHAIYKAAKKINNEPFAVILGDDLISSEVPAILQLIKQYEITQSSIVGVQTVPIEDVNKYGIVDPTRSEEKELRLFEIKGAVEKPEAKLAPSHKAILGRYVFTPEILPILKKIKPGIGGEIQLVDAFEELMQTQKIYAYEFEGTRYDLGSVEGFAKAIIDYSLKEESIKDSIKEHIKNICSKF